MICGQSEQALAIDINRIRAVKPFYVAWVPARTIELAHELEEIRYSLWLPDSAVESKRRKGLVTATELIDHRLLIATIRHSDVTEFARLATSRSRRLASPRGQQLRLRVDECSGEEYRRRNDALERDGKRRRPGSHPNSEVSGHLSPT